MTWEFQESTFLWAWAIPMTIVPLWIKASHASLWEKQQQTHDGQYHNYSKNKRRNGQELEFSRSLLIRQMVYSLESWVQIMTGLALFLKYSLLQILVSQLVVWLWGQKSQAGRHNCEMEDSLLFLCASMNVKKGMGFWSQDKHHVFFVILLPLKMSWCN